MSNAAKTRSTGGLGDAVADLLNAPLRIGIELAKAASTFKLANGKSCCDIPEPCWMPQPLGDVTSFACAGAIATVRLTITNCDMRPRLYTVKATGKDAGLVNIQPTSVTVEPKDCASIQLTFKVPPDAIDGQEFKAIIWLFGCKIHYFVWKVTAGKQNAECCHEIEVEDCPDLIHHWYDHFYCPRPCPTGQKTQVPNG
ncbi:MAG: COG1470 family protein [Planctomycetota bacterium]|jgi:hypothetical protein